MNLLATTPSSLTRSGLWLSPFSFPLEPNVVVDDEVAPVLPSIPPPNELGIEVGVAWVTDGLRLNVLLLDDRMLLGGRDFLPLGFEVIDRLDGLGG